MNFKKNKREKRLHKKFKEKNVWHICKSELTDEKVYGHEERKKLLENKILFYIKK